MNNSIHLSTTKKRGRRKEGKKRKVEGKNGGN
jgi:hypothetical protein